MSRALAPMCRAFDQLAQAESAEEFGRDLLRAAVRRFWRVDRQIFVNNLPWLREENGSRLCDRSLATAILFDQCPGGESSAALRALAECPPEMGFSYPANAGWRLWALARGGRADVIVRDLRQRWATMASVKENNTLQEDWEARPDSGQQWSHCAVVPLYIAFHGLLGLKALAPGFRRFELRPQFADLASVELTAFTVLGPIRARASGVRGGREIVLELPPTGDGELVVPANETVDLPPASGSTPAGTQRFKLPAGTTTVHLREV